MTERVVDREARFGPLHRRLERLVIVREVYGLTGHDEVEYRRLCKLAEPPVRLSGDSHDSGQ